MQYNIIIHVYKSVPLIVRISSDVGNFCGVACVGIFRFIGISKTRIIIKPQFLCYNVVYL